MGLKHLPANLQVAKAPKLIISFKLADHMARDFVCLLTGRAGGFVRGGSPEALVQSFKPGHGNNRKSCIVAHGQIAPVGGAGNTGGQGQSIAKLLFHGLHHGILIEHPQPVLVVVGHRVVGEDALHDLNNMIV